MPESAGSSRAGQHPTRARRVVLALIVSIYVITYMDRVNISSAMPVMQKELGLSIVTVGWIFSSFRWGYALFQIPGGWFGDRVGPRRALACVVCWWSVFTSLTALAWSSTSIGFCRFFFGVGEAGAFPIATRSMSRWMPAEERGFSQGLPHAASRVGAALTPALVVVLMIHFGWRMPFFLFGLLGLVWAAVWYWYYRDRPAEHPGVNAAELELIQRSACAPDVGVHSVPWRAILRSRTVWMLSAMYFCYGYAIDIYLDWFPKYLFDARGMNLKNDGVLCEPAVSGGGGGGSAGWLVFGSVAAPDGESEGCQAGGGGGWVLDCGGGDSAGYVYFAYDCFGVVFLPGGVWAGVDGGGFVGDSDGYWGELCGVGGLDYEYVREPGECDFAGAAGVSGADVWVGCAVCGGGWSLCGGAGVLCPDGSYLRGGDS